MTYLIGIALGLWLVVIPAAVLLLLGVDRSRDEAWEDERPEWADDATPIYDRLVCEAIEREEWSS